MNYLELKPKTKLTDQESSNRLLRSLWAQIRLEFEDTGWIYTPFKQKNEIYLGSLSLGKKSAARVSVKYKKRGVVHTIIFTDTCEGKIFPKERLEKCFRLTEKASEGRFCYRYTILTSDSHSFADISIPSLLKMSASKKGETNLTICVDAFDNTDGLDRTSEIVKQVLGILSVFTNLFFGIKNTRDNFTSRPSFAPFPNTQVTEINKPITATKCHQLPDNENIFDPENDWIDGYPIHSGKLVLPQYCLSFIEQYVSGKLPPRLSPLIDACNHFHAARHFEESQFKSIDIPFVLEEIALVSYVSSLESASLIDAPDFDACITCGQPQYRISSRVTKSVLLTLGEAAASLIKEEYKSRSKYLHNGRRFSSKSYGNISIPLLDSSSQNGARLQIFGASLISLREVISAHIRKLIRNEMNVERETD